MNAPIPPSAFAQERFTVAQIMRLVELGLIAEDADFELIDGEVRFMAPKGPLHEELRTTVTRWLRGLPTTLDFLAETTLWLDADTFVEPDFVVFPAAISVRDLNPADVSLAIEVADSSLRYDLTVKAPRYAAAGVQEVWVIHAPKRTTQVLQRPTTTGWGEVLEVGPGQPLQALIAPDRPLVL